MKFYDGHLRWLYRGGHPSWLARVQNRVGAMIDAA